MGQYLTVICYMFFLYCKSVSSFCSLPRKPLYFFLTGSSVFFLIYKLSLLPFFTSYLELYASDSVDVLLSPTSSEFFCNCFPPFSLAALWYLSMYHLAFWLPYLLTKFWIIFVNFIFFLSSPSFCQVFIPWNFITSFSWCQEHQYLQNYFVQKWTCRISVS